MIYNRTDFFLSRLILVFVSLKNNITWCWLHVICRYPTLIVSKYWPHVGINKLAATLHKIITCLGLKPNYCKTQLQCPDNNIELKHKRAFASILQIVWFYSEQYLTNILRGCFIVLQDFACGWSRFLFVILSNYSKETKKRFSNTP